MQARHSGHPRTSSILTAQGIALAIVIGVFAPTAHAADLTLDSLKDVIPSVSVAGITIYGTVDVGFAYSSHGVSASGAFYPGADYTIYGSRFAGPAIATITNNALEQSKIGVKIEESFGDGWAAIGKLETGFNPISGELSDACASLLAQQRQALQPDGQQRRRQPLRPSLQQRGLWRREQRKLWNAHRRPPKHPHARRPRPATTRWCSPTPSPFWAIAARPPAGIGSTETARWDNSVKYIYQYRPAPCCRHVLQRRPGHAADGPGLRRQYRRRLSGLLD